MVWSVQLLDQKSAPFQGTLRYGSPSFSGLDNRTTPTEAEHVREIRGLHFAKLFSLTHTELYFRGNVVERVRSGARLLRNCGTGAVRARLCVRC